MKSLLMTASLLGSWKYLLECNEDYFESTLEEFKTTLKRMPIQDNEAMKNGREFEDRVREKCDKSFRTMLAPLAENDFEYAGCISECAEECSGGIWQQKASKLVNVSGIDFLLYGRLDVLKGPWIIDLKFSKTFEVGKYRDAPQTKMYLELVPEPVGMKYLVCDGSTLYLDEYRRGDVGSIMDDVRDFWSWLNAYPELKALYIDNWESKY